METDSCSQPAGEVMGQEEGEQQIQDPSQVGWQSNNWSLTLPTQDETEGASATDTGYNTNSGYTTNTRSLDNTNAGPGLDSGCVSKMVPADLTSSSVVVPAPPPQPPPQQQQQYLVSYHNDTNTNDISVGFPLVSSTPSKK